MLEGLRILAKCWKCKYMPLKIKVLCMVSAFLKRFHSIHEKFQEIAAYRATRMDSLQYPGNLNDMSLFLSKGMCYV